MHFDRVHQKVVRQSSIKNKWEIGEKHPSGPSLKLLDLLDRKGPETLI
jgi:putative transcriptional regulator